MGEEQRSQFIRAIETQTIVEKFGQMAQGEAITDEEINTLVGEEAFVANKRHIVESAREIARHEYHINIERIENTGYRVLTDSETATYPWVAKLRNTAQRHARLCTYVKHWDGLTPDERYRQQVSLTLCRLSEEITGKQGQKKLLENIKQTEKAIDLKETMKLFYET